MVLELITQWLNPLREFSAPSFTPQSESAAPLIALLYRRWYVLRTSTTGTIQYRSTVQYSFSPQWESVGPLSLKHSGPHRESIV